MLGEVLRTGAQRLLAEAVDAEVAAYIEKHQHLRDDEGHRLVVRNGRQKPRKIDTGVGEIDVRQPRVNDRRVDEDGDRIRFTSKILPPDLRRTRNLEDLVPLALPQGDLDERLLRVPPAASRHRHREPVADDSRPPKGGLVHGRTPSPSA